MLIRLLATSRWGPAVGFAIVRLLPTKFAYRLGNIFAYFAARNRNSPLYKGIRVNQSVVRDIPYDDPRLDDIVYEVLAMNAKGFVDFFKAIAEGEEGVRKRCVIDEPITSKLEEWSKDDRGVIVVGPHLLGFDMFILYLAIIKLPILVISYPDPRGSYVAQNILRMKFGMDMKPSSVESLRYSMKHLRQGKIIMTGVDRTGLGGERLEFFGRQAVLPVGHARLAVKMNARVVIGIPYLDESGLYHGMAAEVLDPPNSGDEMRDAHELAQRILSIFETHIRKRPERWLMFFPVWPEVLPKEEK
jgi:lauroyl/myristoyl acyltransferase